MKLWGSADQEAVAWPKEEEGDEGRRHGVRGRAASSQRYSEAVDLELLRLRDSDFREELDDVVPLVSLQLHHLTILLVLHDGSVARELLRHSSGARDTLAD